MKYSLIYVCSVLRFNFKVTKNRTIFMADFQFIKHFAQRYFISILIRLLPVDEPISMVYQNSIEEKSKTVNFVANGAHPFIIAAIIRQPIHLHN